MFYSVFKQLAFKLDPETIHDVIINSSSNLIPGLKLMGAFNPDSKHQLTAGELTWKFPVGLAAGFDKNAKAISFFRAMGLGAIEVGTVTKIAQAGNPKPRIWRHAPIDSLQNSMGFPNGGAEEMTQNLQKSDTENICLGVNIGKNKDTSEADTAAEYAFLYERFAPFADYMAINISSPNTPGLRQFQDKSKLLPLLQAISEVRKENYRPCFIKISPDMEEQDIKLVCELSKEQGYSGVIATNTTIQHSFGKGGLSGKFVKPMALRTRKLVCDNLKEDPSQTIIGVGGIDSYEEIKEFWQMGGSFVQVYTALIYEGPQLLNKIAKDMSVDMKRQSVNTVQELFESYKS